MVWNTQATGLQGALRLLGASGQLWKWRPGLATAAEAPAAVEAAAPSRTHWLHSPAGRHAAEPEN